MYVLHEYVVGAAGRMPCGPFCGSGLVTGRAASHAAGGLVGVQLWYDCLDLTA